MLNILSLFSGIGAFEKALENLGVEFNLLAFCEFDKYASKSYCAIHGVDESKNLGDISRVDETKLPKNIDILTYGFPCQDISISGKQKGLFNEDGTQTRSGLFFEALRIIEATKPKIAIAENVKNLTSKKFNAQFQIVLASLEAAGYNNYWKVLNAKDYGVPQNRERVFIVSIRKDIDHGLFQFPEGFPLEKRLKDVLEDEVDEKYHLSAEAMSQITTSKSGHCDLIQVGQMYGTEREPNPQAGRVYGVEGISPTMDTCSGGNRMPKVAVAMRGRYDGAGNVQQTVEVSNREYANAITTVQKDSLVGEPIIVEDFYKNRDERTYYDYSPTLRADRNGLKVCNNLHIRKLTPKECFRLMGFDDESFQKAEVVNSNTQLYKQAGNSIVVDVLEELFCMMLDESGNLYV